MRRISSFEELDEVMSNLHDCPFDLDEAKFDKEAGTWSATFFRPLWEAPSADHHRVKLAFWRWRWHLPVAQASVKVTGVRDVQIIADQGIGRYTLDKIKLISDGVRLSFCEALDIDLHLAAGIEATYDEQPLPGKRAVYRGFLSLESGPGIEEAVEGD